MEREKTQKLLFEIGIYSSAKLTKGLKLSERIFEKFDEKELRIQDYFLLQIVTINHIDWKRRDFSFFTAGSICFL